VDNTAGGYKDALHSFVGKKKKREMIVVEVGEQN